MGPAERGARPTPVTRPTGKKDVGRLLVVVGLTPSPLAMFLGLRPTPIEACRVLEFGCNDGAHLIPMVYALPTARFTLTGS
jgi:hypothetical protein